MQLKVERALQVETQNKELKNKLSQAEQNTDKNTQMLEEIQEEKNKEIKTAEH